MVALQKRHPPTFIITLALPSRLIRLGVFIEQGKGDGCGCNLARGHWVYRVWWKLFMDQNGFKQGKVWIRKDLKILRPRQELTAPI